MLSLFFYLVIFLFGLIVGSFLNCVIYRLEIGESFLKGRSYCPHCKHILSWQDLIPIFSFLILKGRCRYCHQKISWQYPLVEISTATLFLLILLNWPYFSSDRLLFMANLFFWWIISGFLIIIFVYDLKHYFIPDKVIYPAILVSGIWYLVSGIFLNLYTKDEILNTIYSAIGAAAFFLIIVLISHEKWMGMGDVKLAFLMGIFLGSPNILVALFLAFFTGAVVGLVLIALGRKTFKSEIPFGPFLVTGTFLAMFFGQKIIDFYLNLFLLK